MDPKPRRHGRIKRTADAQQTTAKRAYFIQPAMAIKSSRNGSNDLAMGVSLPAADYCRDVKTGTIH